MSSKWGGLTVKDRNHGKLYSTEIVILWGGGLEIEAVKQEAAQTELPTTWFCLLLNGVNKQALTFDSSV